MTYFLETCGENLGLKYARATQTINHVFPTPKWSIRSRQSFPAVQVFISLTCALIILTRMVSTRELTVHEEAPVEQMPRQQMPVQFPVTPRLLI